MEKQMYDVLKSKRFWSQLIGLLAMLLVGALPELQEHIDVLIPGVLGIVGVAIGGFAIEDAARARNETNDVQ
jgi:hypothetical protein